MRINLDKLQALRAGHERMRADYASRAELVRFGANQVESLRAELVRVSKSDEAIRLLKSNPIELAAYPAEALKLSNVDVHTLRKLIAAQSSLVKARQDADAQAAIVAESAALMERLNTYALRFPEAA